MQPVFTQVPPNRCRSISATVMPVAVRPPSQRRTGLAGAHDDGVEPVHDHKQTIEATIAAPSGPDPVLGPTTRRSLADPDNAPNLVAPIMSTEPIAFPPTSREPELLGQTVVVIGGSAGIGLETARRARSEGAKLILTGRSPETLRHAASELDAQTAAFDATDAGSLERFFSDLPTPIDHVMVTAGRPTYGRLVDMDLEQVRRALEEHLLLAFQVARHAVKKVRAGGTLLFMGGTGARRPAIGLAIASTVTAALPALTASLALELAPIRVNLIAPGFVDTPLSASLLGEELETRRNQLRATLPIRRVVGPADVAALAVHIMSNTALTGATYDIDGGQQLVSA